MLSQGSPSILNAMAVVPKVELQQHVMMCECHSVLEYCRATLHDDSPSEYVSMIGSHGKNDLAVDMHEEVKGHWTEEEAGENSRAGRG